MSNYLEYNDRMAFHPGYYVKEMVEESGLTQEDFARRMGTTPKNLSILLKGEQSLSIEMAARLSRLLGTSVNYWLNLQQAFDELKAEFLLEEELLREREVFRYLDYGYFRDHFGLPDLPRNIDEQIRHVREFLSVSSLTVLKFPDLAVSFRSYSQELSVSNIINANAMVQIAINQALKMEGPHYERKRFLGAVEYALTQTANHQGFFRNIKEAFREAGVALIALPHLRNSGINGATKKVRSTMLLMVSDRRQYADTFWFSLLHEIGHILTGDFGITLDQGKYESEDQADGYARKKLIPQAAYESFLKSQSGFDADAIREFAETIGRDPGIVLGRLLRDGYVSYKDKALSAALRHKYRIYGD